MDPTRYTRHSVCRDVQLQDDHGSQLLPYSACPPTSFIRCRVPAVQLVPAVVIGVAAQRHRHATGASPDNEQASLQRQAAEALSEFGAIMGSGNRSWLGVRLYGVGDHTEGDSGGRRRRHARATRQAGRIYRMTDQSVWPPECCAVKHRTGSHIGRQLTASRFQTVPKSAKSAIGRFMHRNTSGR
jgi:hypothetical protein